MPGSFEDLGGGMPELLRTEGGVCRNFWGLKGGYAGTFGGSGGYAGTFEGGVCRNFWGHRGGYAGTFGGSGGGMPELLGT